MEIKEKRKSVCQRLYATECPVVTKHLDHVSGRVHAFVYQFNVEGAGEWFIDLRDENKVGGGSHASADCTIVTDKETFDSMIGNPMQAMAAFMSGKLTADNIGLATKLQSFLG